MNRLCRVSDTFDDGKTENVIIRRSLSLVSKVINVPIPESVPPANEYVDWNLYK